MGAEEALRQTVLGWVKQTAGDPIVAEHAAAAALYRYQAGATVSDACRAARSVLDRRMSDGWSWSKPDQATAMSEMAS